MKNTITVVIDKRKCLCWPKGSLIIIPIKLEAYDKSWILLFNVQNASNYIDSTILKDTSHLKLQEKKTQKTFKDSLHVSSWYEIHLYLT